MTTELNTQDIVLHTLSGEFGTVDSIDSHLNTLSFHTNPQRGAAKQRKVALTECVYVDTQWAGAWKRLGELGVIDPRISGQVSKAVACVNYTKEALKKAQKALEQLHSSAYLYRECVYLNDMHARGFEDNVIECKIKIKQLVTIGTMWIASAEALANAQVEYGVDEWERISKCLLAELQSVFSASVVDYKRRLSTDRFADYAADFSEEDYH